MKNIKLTQGEYALVDDEDFDWLNQWKWCLSNTGYAVRNIGENGVNKQILMHRVIIDTPIGMETDHINRDKLDNRHSNLRICTSAENKYNRNINKGSSIYKGVSWDKYHKRWLVNIKVNKHKTIAYFQNERHAAMAYDIWAKELHKDFALLNFT